MNNGRLQTAEHILCRHLQTLHPEVEVVIAKFPEHEGLLELRSEVDLRYLDKQELQNIVNEVISRHLPVSESFVSREEAAKSFDIRRLPEHLAELRIISIGEFDARPCKDPHVSNTNEIGEFVMRKIKRVGSGRYRFTFVVQ